MPVRVLIVDDSPLFLEVLESVVASSPGLELAGSAHDGREAVRKVLSLSPDVVTLDVEMPVMDGLATLARIMEVRPTRVIMVSSHTRSATATTIRALELGACDFVGKPTQALRKGYEALRGELVEKIAAIGARPYLTSRPRSTRGESVAEGRKARVVVIGGSTGGTTVLAGIINSLPARMRSTVIAVQHLPGLYTQEFARRLSQTAACPIHLARAGDLVEPGTVYLAPGGFHLSVYGNTFRVQRGEPVNGHQPSIDVAMSSVARRFCPDVCGVLLTGIGRDGAAGIEEIRDAGGLTVAQDEETSVVFGMPRAAIATGKVDLILGDSAIRAALAVMVVN
jgi:two-component system, chemotaxis family, protein-glutamate methylesterase/glutaminase